MKPLPILLLFFLGPCILAGCGQGNSSAPATTAGGGAGTAAAGGGAAVAAPKRTGDQHPGSVNVSVSFLYSKAVGLKPDAGAQILLLPQGTGPLNAELTHMDVPSQLDQVTKAGGFYLKIPDDGKGTIANVPPGPYKCYFVSENSRSDETDHEAIARMMSGVIRDWLSVANKEAAVEDVEVPPGKSVAVSHAFGQ